MKPHYNSCPQHPKQIQSNGNAAPVQPQTPQVLPTNPSLANLCNMLRNSIPMQPQHGIINAQIPVPFNNSNTIMPNVPPLLIQQPGFVNHMGQNQMGFVSQNHLNNIHAVPMFFNQGNPCQPQAQSYPFNFSNLPQNLNQNMGLSNLQNLIHNLNAVMPIQMPNPSPVIAPQNPNYFTNPSFMVGQLANPIRQNFVEEKSNQHVQGNLPTMQQTQNSRSCSFRRQGNPVNNGQNRTSGPNRKNFASKNFKKNPTNKEESNLGYHKSHFLHMNNGKRKFGLSNEHKGKGYGYERASKYTCTNPAEQAGEEKRTHTLTYTEQEIKQWREDRRKNYPSKANIDKNCNERQKNFKGLKDEAKQRREQLKDILAKQAELGVEVAEIPSYYLSDSEKQVNERERNKRNFAKKGRYQNRNDRRGRYNKNDRLANKDSSQMNARKPTLLQKLLSADARREKHQLLQAFRFMVINSFFDNVPEKLLKFPLVEVKEDGGRKDVLEVKNFDDEKEEERSGYAEEINGTGEEGEIID